MLSKSRWSNRQGLKCVYTRRDFTTMWSHHSGTYFIIIILSSSQSKKTWNVRLYVFDWTPQHLARGLPIAAHKQLARSGVSAGTPCGFTRTLMKRFFPQTRLILLRTWLDLSFIGTFFKGLHFVYYCPFLYGNLAAEHQNFCLWFSFRSGVSQHATWNLHVRVWTALVMIVWPHRTRLTKDLTGQGRARGKHL